MIRRPQRPWPPTARSAAAIIATAGPILVAAACSGSPSSTGSGGSANAGGSAQSQQLGFSRCMRSRGVLNLPDPAGSRGFPNETPRQLGVSSSEFQAAESACIRLLPNGGQPTPAELQQSWSDMASFARCMRSHGVPNWPDPTRYPQHPERPTFNLQPVGIDPTSRQIGTEIHECDRCCTATTRNNSVEVGRERDGFARPRPGGGPATAGGLDQAPVQVSAVISDVVQPRELHATRWQGR
jgi:hypothetical protein